MDFLNQLLLVIKIAQLACNHILIDIIYNITRYLEQRPLILQNILFSSH